MSTPDDARPLPRGSHLKRAIALYHQGRFDRMEAEARAELADDPDDHEALTWLGLALYKLGREEEALRVLADAVRVRPDYADAHYVRALVHRRLGMVRRMMGALAPSLAGANVEHERQAEDAIAEALRLDPRSPEYHDFVADLRREQGRLDEALAAAERALALDPHHAGGLYNRALILDRLDRREEARAAYGLALAQTPENAGLHRHFGEFLLRSDAPGPALEHLREALRLDPNEEASLRPLIAEAMKQRSRTYRWIADHIDSWWLLAGFLGVLVALAWVGTDSRWPVFVVLYHGLPFGIGLVLLFLSLITALNPGFNLALCRSEFGRLMLADDERRQAYTLAASLAVALAAAAWHLLALGGLVVGVYTSVLLLLFCLFWIDPLMLWFDLYPRSLQRIAGVCTVLSIVLVLVHLGLRLFGPAKFEDWGGWWPWAVVPLAAGLLLLLVPFILSRSASEFSIWKPAARRRAVLVFWGLLLLSWSAYIIGWFVGDLLPGAAGGAVQRSSLVVGVVFGLLLSFEERLVAWLAARFGEVPSP